MKTDVISKPATFVRLAASRGRASGKPVEREGGKYGAGLIRGVSVITRGEALGHRAWIDDTTLQQVADAINATGQKGAKSRFTHPSLSGDGLGTLLGRAIGPAEVQDGKVIADLHIAKSAHATPNGDIGGYTMQLAEDDPESFGTSIVFAHDVTAEDEFEAANQAEEEIEDGKGRKRKRYAFRSPDADNVNHYRHVRIKTLRAVDAVDSPAANPAGLFSRGQDIPREADALLSYALGLTSDRPDVSLFGVDPDRATAFVARFLESRGLSVKEESMSKEVVATPDVKAEAKPEEKPAERTYSAAEINRYVSAFGAENGLKWCTEGRAFEACYAEHAKALESKLSAEKERADKAEKALADVKLGEVTPVSGGDDKNGKPKSLADMFKIPR